MKYFEDAQEKLNELLNVMAEMGEDEFILTENSVKEAMHSMSPMSNEPVNCVVWVKNEMVYANDYNPNSVASPEMELLKHSISEDGYTQPIVTFPVDSQYEVVDGFHRNRVGKEYPEITERVKGYLPVVRIRKEQSEKTDRMASTIRHNRARGKHKVEAMSDIVVELKRRNWTNKRIAKNLGMDEDEVLRLCQITGMAELFSDEEFSKSWDVGLGQSVDEYRFVNDGDEDE